MKKALSLQKESKSRNHETVRLVFTLMLLVGFTFAQTAQAFDDCCNDTPSIEHQLSKAEKPTDSQGKAPHQHCTAASHAAAPLMDSKLDFEAPALADAQTHWPDTAIGESFIGEGLIEPPAHA